jgi:hypothetical protein
MSKKQKKELKETANVEFGVEFGDLNAAKMYERPFPQKKKKNKK